MSGNNPRKTHKPQPTAPQNSFGSFPVGKRAEAEALSSMQLAEGGLFISKYKD
jgi:hypothetical protein